MDFHQRLKLKVFGGRENPADEQWFNGYSNRNNGTGSYCQTKYDNCSIPRTHELSDTFYSDALKADSFYTVTVQYIKNPSEFWVQTDWAMERLEAMQLKMSEIYYCGGGDDFTLQSPKVGILCAALIKPDGFYRVTVKAVHGRKVNVYFVDHGNETIVDQQDLRILSSEHRKTPALAFKCSLSGITPTDQQWSQKAINFFEYEAKQILLDMYVSAQCKDAYLVELFYKTAGLRSINEMMCLEGLAVKDVSNDRYSPRPDSGCSTAEGSGEDWTEGDIKRCNCAYDFTEKYSAPEIAVGSVEQVWITCVKDVHKFYGQLVRHAGVIEKLNERIMFFCRRPQGTKCSLAPGAPCFAKYSDGQWYRGRVKITHPIVLVHFLDYGDIVAVKKSDILPVPDEASEIMSFPVQAIEFYLSDVPVDTSSDVNRWFDKHATGQHFTAKVQEKHPSGKYTVELYDGKLNVNKAVKEKAVGTGWRTHKVLNYPAVPQTSTCSTVRKGKMSVMVNDGRKHVNPPLLHRSENEIAAYNIVSSNLNNSAIPPVFQKFEKMAHTPKEDFGTTEPSSLPVRRTNGDSAMGVTASSYKAFPNPPKIEKPVSFKGTPCRPEPSSASLPKLDDLPDRHVIPNVETEVYVSHVNSHSSFFVQLVEDEDKIHSLVEKLNSNANQPCNMSDVDVKNLQVGEIVVAMFPDDCSWYRAVIKKVNDCGAILVEFIDFGNEATVLSNMVRSLNNFLDTPRLSVHCCLNANGIPGFASDEERTSRLKAMAEGEVKKMICMFVKRPGSVWEVCFVDPGTTNNVLLTSQANLSSTPHMDTCNVSETKRAASTPDVPRPSEYGQQRFKLADLPSRPIKPGIVTEVYISHVNSQDSFFVQLVEDEDQIFALVEELNTDQPSSLSTDLRTLQEGDLISALYAEDEAWYRAVVKKVNDDSILVEFIDFGNEASVTANMVNSLKKKFLDTPQLSVHCCLGSDVRGPFNRTVKEEIASILKDNAKGEAKMMSCFFIKEFGNVWEICLIDSGATEPSQKTEDSAMMVLSIISETEAQGTKDQNSVAATLITVA